MRLRPDRRHDCLVKQVDGGQAELTLDIGEVRTSWRVTRRSGKYDVELELRAAAEGAQQVPGAVAAGHLPGSVLISRQRLQDDVTARRRVRVRWQVRGREGAVRQDVQRRAQ